MAFEEAGSAFAVDGGKGGEKGDGSEWGLFETDFHGKHMVVVVAAVVVVLVVVVEKHEDAPNKFQKKDVG